MFDKVVSMPLLRNRLQLPILHFEFFGVSIGNYVKFPRKLQGLFKYVWIF